jgi:hypothetical protein
VKAFDKRHLCNCGGAVLYPYPLFTRADYEQRMSLSSPSRLSLCSSSSRRAEGGAGEGGYRRVEHEAPEREPPGAMGGVDEYAGGSCVEREDAGAGRVEDVNERPVVCFCNAHNLL